MSLHMFHRKSESSHSSRRNATVGEVGHGTVNHPEEILLA